MPGKKWKEQEKSEQIINDPYEDIRYKSCQSGSSNAYSSPINTRSGGNRVPRGSSESPTKKHEDNSWSTVHRHPKRGENNVATTGGGPSNRGNSGRGQRGRGRGNQRVTRGNSSNRSAQKSSQVTNKPQKTNLKVSSVDIELSFG